jgi:hypothetical protein
VAQIVPAHPLSLNDTPIIGRANNSNLGSDNVLLLLPDHAESAVDYKAPELESSVAQIVPARPTFSEQHSAIGRANRCVDLGADNVLLLQDRAESVVQCSRLQSTRTRIISGSNRATTPHFL